VPDKPHILIIMPDQQRGDAMGCAGNPVIQTPNTDRLAAEGMRFHGVTPSAICMAARSSFITGMFPHQTGVWSNKGGVPADADTLFHHLQDAGWRTAHVGKSHYIGHVSSHLKEDESYMHGLGFDHVHEVTGPRATRGIDSHMSDHLAKIGLLDTFRDDYNARDTDWAFNVWPSPLPWEEYLDSYVGRKATEWIDNAENDDPTCMYVGFPGPHEPWDAPEPYASMYKPSDMPEAIPPSEQHEWLDDSVWEKTTERRVEDIDPAKVAAIRSSYYGKISLIDHWVGEILAAYERKGWLDNTLVIYFSDHGEMGGDHDQIYKSVQYRGSADVPFIVRWPGHVAEGVSTDAFAQCTDIFPTIDELIGRESPANLAGRSLWPTLRDPSVHSDMPGGGHAAFMEVWNGSERISMVQTDRHKYVVDNSGAGLSLFDTVNDPDERVNLVGHPDHKQTETDLRDHLLRWMIATTCAVV
jgi:arylsulfatase